MKLSHIALISLSALLLAGCAGKVDTAIRSQDSQTTTQTSETTVDPMSIGTSAEVQADTTIQVPPSKTSDDVNSIKADLDATVVTEESF